MMPKKKRPRGRPATRVMPELIPASAADVVRAISQGPPKKEWDCDVNRIPDADDGKHSQLGILNDCILP